MFILSEVSGISLIYRLQMYMFQSSSFAGVFFLFIEILIYCLSAVFRRIHTFFKIFSYRHCFNSSVQNQHNVIFFLDSSIEIDDFRERCKTFHNGRKIATIETLCETSNEMKHFLFKNVAS